MSKRSTIDEVYNILKSRILTCEYKPGQLIFEKEIVDELGVSRTPVREALNILNGEGLLHIIPKKGIQITSLSVKKMKQIYEIRKILEPVSVSQAIRNIKPSHIEYLTNLDKTLRTGFDRSDVTDIFKYGMDIHLYIADLSGNEVLVSILKWLREESYRGYVYYLKQYMDRCTDDERKIVEEKTINNHSKIVEALKEGDEQRAIKHVVEDLNIFIQFISDY
ncbi:GntR family transcriptional regulator [Lutispora saccharofermentans]|uniref:GntR family transcriptional regulator n=1 Tax=Lutispora saccharofermentans TaxID=3024236 RepID=A0ABT1ND83_9FIRM|nr:GntR family transcriptional regulator [Lutispora saccharofermentans]